MLLGVLRTQYNPVTENLHVHSRDNLVRAEDYLTLRLELVAHRSAFEITKMVKLLVPHLLRGLGHLHEDVRGAFVKDWAFQNCRTFTGALTCFNWLSWRSRMF